MVKFLDSLIKKLDCTHKETTNKRHESPHLYLLITRKTNFLREKCLFLSKDKEYPLNTELKKKNFQNNAFLNLQNGGRYIFFYFAVTFTN